MKASNPLIPTDTQDLAELEAKNNEEQRKLFLFTIENYVLPLLFLSFII